MLKHVFFYALQYGTKLLDSRRTLKWRKNMNLDKAKELGLVNDQKMRFSIDNQLFLYVLNNTYEINVMILLKRLRSIQQSSINLIFFSILII